MFSGKHFLHINQNVGFFLSFMDLQNVFMEKIVWDSTDVHRFYHR